jgi:hypothetical protein
MDHSPGNTLIKKVSENQYQFFSGWFKQNEFSWIDGFWYANENLSKLTPKDDPLWVIGMLSVIQKRVRGLWKMCGRALVNFKPFFKKT